jgi:uncharacterized protein YcfJ
MKALFLTTAIALTATTAFAEDGLKTTAYVGDSFTTAYESVPYTKRECVNVKVPVYGTVQRQGDAAGGALLGMLLGGAIGKGVSGNSDGAAAGAVIGGLIGADKGAKPKSEQVITGYTTEKRCDDVTYYRDKEIVVYEYSVISFIYEGRRYELTFEK